ncbi:hypothetical protein AOQ84DRAFT_384591 [Glonium stellatum]|uniref:DUF7918 domain-containing protein n=1 Tax=Glonium stellatum TaxID=574774 RepID=A0A8E2FCS4_9PEZI|nr:hypothetical protein AOQ84DRAFT_384591 [Glonium stellatum]
MPKFKGITVKVETQNGVELDEYGVRKMSSRNFCSSYIQAETDVSFQISLTPDIKFFKDYYEALGIRPSRKITRPRRYRHQSRRPLPSDDDYMNELDESDELDEWDYKELNQIYTNKRSKLPAKGPQEFHLLATIYIDGRVKYERQAIVYLDPSHHNVSRADGKVWVQARYSKANDGTIVEHKWVFKDVGIETMFDKLLLSGDVKEENNKEDEDTIIEAMNSLGTEERDGDKEEANAGVIKITLQRVTLGKEYKDEDFDTPYREDEDVDVDMADANKVTHTTRLTKGRGFYNVVPVITYKALEESEYATFKFFYRSKDILRKFGFANFPQSPRLPPTTIARGRLQETMSFMTPLSVSNLHPLGMTPPTLRTIGQKSSENQSSEKKTGDDKGNEDITKLSKNSIMKSSFTTFRDSRKIDALKGKGKDQITTPLGVLRPVNINKQHVPRSSSPNADINSPSDSEEDSDQITKSFTQSFKGTSKSPVNNPSNEANKNEETPPAISKSLTKHALHGLASSSSADALPALGNKSDKFTAIRHPNESEPAGSDADDEADSSEVESKDAVTNLQITSIDTSNGISENRDDRGLHEEMKDITIAQPGMKRKSRSSSGDNVDTDNDDDDEVHKDSGAGPACLSTIALLKYKKPRSSSSTPSGYCAGSDSSAGHTSDNTTPKPSPPPLLSLLPGITVTAPSGDEAEGEQAEEVSR